MTDAASARDAERDLVVVDRGAFKELFDEMMHTRTKIAKDRIEIVNGALLALSYASDAALSAPAAPAADAGTGEQMDHIKRKLNEQKETIKKLEAARDYWRQVTMSRAADRSQDGGETA